MKAVILAAGEGKRLRPLTSTRPKPMIPIVGKPLLEYIIVGIRKAGIKEILLIVGYKQEVIQNYFSKKQEELDVNITYITQEEYLGTAHATGYAENFVGDDNFLLLYGDILVETEIFERVVSKFINNKVDGLISLRQVENPESYGIISLNKDGFVEQIVEKPSPDLNVGNLANAGIYVFSTKIFEAIRKTPLSERKEYEFTDSMEILINQLNGNIFGFNMKTKFWNDIGLPWQIFDANKYILDNLKREINGEIEKNVFLQGKIHIGNGTIVKSGTYIQGPCYIGRNSRIGPNAFLRPYSVIGDNCHIGISEVKNSVIFSDSNVPHFNYIGDSIICENVNLGAGTKVANLRLDNENIKLMIKGKRIDSGRRKMGTIIGPNVKTGINVSIMCGKKINENAIVGAHTIINEI
ncbi:MAG: sugar phosphate nucleotidyltransferase [Candidatus Lokiarchaeota archaeon]